VLLSEVFDQRSIILDLKSADKDAVFGELIEAIADVHPEFDRAKMFSVIQERENKKSTSIIPGVAVPHGYYPDTGLVLGAVGISKPGINYGTHDPVHFVFLILMGENVREKHLYVLNRLLALINSGALAALGNAKSVREVYDQLCRPF
jgi:mannitol/fructose-specific phosphotransferase system IIA component (Ntr-type)